ncbi:DUF2004 domain-containing protein [Agromyces seonyuensis]|uniref:DUF2004 domain-containing protein n=1 Tax=Agromyces seonyuensis TaxID=2662446 RepID=A0A6I4P4M5_9MICO|nr:DUF2004 domain-containing protein [Agromyces seonyuensis]MWB98274.1 DUF2004 domain-containing protein [Agromyces seonyuensis]
MTLEHDYFGLIGDYWSERRQFADQDVEVVLDADADFVSTDALDRAAGFISDLEDLDGEIREAFVGQLASSSSTVVAFLNALFDGDEETLEIAEESITRDSGDQQIDALRSLSLVRVDLRPDADGGGESFAEFEYALAPEDLDDRLVIVLDITREVVDVRHES